MLTKKMTVGIVLMLLISINLLSEQGLNEICEPDFIYFENRIHGEMLVVFIENIKIEEIEDFLTSFQNYEMKNLFSCPKNIRIRYIGFNEDEIQNPYDFLEIIKQKDIVYRAYFRYKQN